MGEQGDYFRNSRRLGDSDLLRKVIDNLPDYIYVKDIQSRFVVCNRAVAAGMGAVTVKELIGKTDFDFYPQQLAENYFADEQQIIRTGQPLTAKEEITSDAHGKKRWFLSTKVPLTDDGGKIVGIVGIGRDITDRKREEQIRAEQHNLLRTLVDNLPDSVYVKDAKCRFVIANTRSAHQAGTTTPDELTGKTDRDFYPEQLASKYYADEQRVMQSGEPLINREEQVINQSTGQKIWSLSSKVPWVDRHGNIMGVIGIGRDITDRKKIEAALLASNERLEAANQQLRAGEQQLKAANQQLRAGEQQLKATNQQLRASEQQLKAANQQLAAGNQQLTASERQLKQERQRQQKYLDLAGALIVVIDKDQNIALMNKNGLEMLQCEQQDVLGRNWFDTFLPKSAQKKAKAVFERLMAKEVEPVEYTEGLVLTKTGQQRIVCWHNAVLTDENGDVINVVISGMDVTDRRLAEQKLAEEHNLLRTLIDNMPDYIYVKDAKSRFLIANIAVARGMGAASPDELVGKTDFDFYPKQSADSYYADEQKIIRTGRPMVGREELATDQQGIRKWFSSTKVPLEDGAGKIVGIVGIGRDITERKEAEQALRATNQQLQATEQQLRAANQQLRAGEQQLKAANQQLNASNQQLRAGEEELRRLNQQLQHRIRELDCLYGLSKLDEQREVSLQRIFPRLLKLIPPAWQYPEITAARIVFEQSEFKSDKFRETAWKQSAEIKINGQKVGTIEVCYLEKRPAADEGPFLQEERSLLNVLAERLGHIAQRRRAEKRLLDYQAQLRSLASELSLAEERERYRVATELHDRISQLLVISKVKLETMRGSVPSASLAKNLQEVCKLLDETIQNTRSLTFDLGSPILYELGFEAAVAEWLTEEIQKKHGIDVQFHDDGRAKLLSDDISALLFRMVRELLINVVKHANAKKVKVSIRKVASEVCICVEDDGVGFNVTEAASIGTKTGGFGLFSIRERLEQLGGRLEIESETDRGTKVTVMAPLKRPND